jgi:hypothetical protein
MLLPILLMWISPICGAQESDRPAPTSTESSGKPQNRPNNRSQRAEDKKAPAPEAITVINQTNTTQTNKESADVAQDKNQKASTDRWLMIFTGVLAAVAVLQFFTLVWQISTTKSTSEKELRAYVFPSSATRFRENGVLKLKMVFTNSGKTPARACITWVFEGIHVGSSEPVFPKAPPNDTHSIYFIAAGGTTEIFDDAVPTSAEVYEFIRTGIRSLYLSGAISYRDVFNKTRTTQFRFVSRTSDFEAGRFVFCEEGNEAT